MVAAAVAILFSAGLIYWQVKARKAEAVNLSAEDMTIIAEDQSPQIRARLAMDEKARKDFAKDVQRILAVAEEAHNSGVDGTPEIRRQLEFQRAVEQVALPGGEKVTGVKSQDRKSTL